jgi:hypothetical protein
MRAKILNSQHIEGSECEGITLWQLRIIRGGKEVYLDLFNSLEKAVAAQNRFLAWEREEFGGDLD